MADSFGEMLASARERAGLSQTALAAKSGTSQSAIARLERGQVSPSLGTIRRLLGAAGFDIQIILVARDAADPVIAAYKRDVDRTLLRDNLSKSVDRRLRDIEAFHRDAGELRRAVSLKRRK